MRTPDAPMGWPMPNLRAERRFAQRIATGALAAKSPTTRVDLERLAEDTQSAGRRPQAAWRIAWRPCGRHPPRVVVVERFQALVAARSLARGMRSRALCPRAQPFPVVQRTSSDLRLNPHLHVVALDGVFAEQTEGSPQFVQLPELASLDVAEALSTIRSRVVRLLVRRGVVETQTSGELEFAYSDDAERAPALAHLTAAAVSGLPPCRLGMPPAGPERRARADRAPLHLAHAAGATITGALCATESGFSLHAATVASVLGASSSPCLAGRRDPAPARSAASTRRDDPVGKAALLRYVLRRHAGTVLGASLRCAVSTPRHAHSR